jgi:hypothetical protein
MKRSIFYLNWRAWAGIAPFKYEPKSVSCACALQCWLNAVSCRVWKIYFERRKPSLRSFHSPLLKKKFRAWLLMKINYCSNFFKKKIPNRQYDWVPLRCTDFIGWSLHNFDEDTCSCIHPTVKIAQFYVFGREALHIGIWTAFFWMTL